MICMKKQTFALLAFGLLFSVKSIGTTPTQNPSPDKKSVYKNASYPVDKRVDDLVKRMTIQEKIGQLSCLLGWDMYSKSDKDITVSEQFKKVVQEQQIGMLWATLRADPWTRKTLKNGLTPEQAALATNALQKYVMENTRLGIPLFLAEECAHGHMAIGTTVFPTSIGQSSTWDPALIQEMAKTIAAETRAQGAHIGYGPILDLARDPRWSRVEETYGEDPYLNGQMGIAVVKGFQGNRLNSGDNIISTLKHFIAYGISEGGHNGGSVNLGNRELYQEFLPPFRDAVNAGALSIMTAYNSVDGVPCTSNAYLLKEVVEKGWGFKGFWVSDLSAIAGLRSAERVAETPVDAAAQAINAGVNVDLSGADYGKNLMDAYKQGLVKMEDIDRSVRKVLTLKFAMGLFDNPYVIPSAVKVRTEANIFQARKVARESIVLLKNEKEVLPLKKDIKRIAVIGPNADNQYNQLGDYTAPQEESNVVTVLEGIKAKISGNCEITYVKGCAVRDTSKTSIQEAVAAARNADVAVLVLGGSSARDFKTDYEATGAASVSATSKDEHVSDMECGEGYDRSTIGLLGKQTELLKQVAATGTPVVVVLIEGRPLNLNGMESKATSILTAWYPGQEGGNAIADVLFGDYNPAGRLPITMPKSVGQLPMYYNYKSPAHHDYVEVDSKPLFCFGHGLSYTRFEYSQIQVNTPDLNKDVKVTVSFELKNAGSRDGEEVVQLYLRDQIASVVTPEKQLKRFQRIFLKSGEKKTITFELGKEDFALYNAALQRIVEPGNFSLMVGASSEDIRLNTSVQIKKEILIPVK